MKPELYGLVLSGGRSTRMGRDKGALVYGKGALVYGKGESQRSRCFRLLSQVCTSVFISCRKDQSDLIPSEFPRIYDLIQEVGPIGGILSAFAFAPHKAWLVWACDMPMIGESEIERLVKMRNFKKEATVYSDSIEGRLEPLFAIWEPQGLKKLEFEHRKGNHSPRRVLEALKCEILVASKNQDFSNINTWQDYLQKRDQIQTKSLSLNSQQ